MAEHEKINTYLLSLIYSLSATAMHQLGKVSNPVTSKTEKDLDQARMSIDIIEMLNEKTKGNLTPEEEKLISSTLASLQLNYVYELEKETKGEQRTN